MPRPIDDPRQGDRIAKLLARAGVASRREIERMIAEGRVALDGTPVTTPATLLRSLHGVTVDGEPVAAPAPARLFLYHKPAGLLVTERDPRGRPTIYDRLPRDLPRVVPVGRLDLNTEGLLLLTTDGELKRALELPANGVERTYRARAYGQVSQPALEELIHGIEIDGIRYGQIDANLERRTGANAWIEMTLTEGKNREVRRVLEHLGLEVGRLIRIRYGPFVLGDLPPGAVGEVRQADLIAFRQALAGKRKAGPERVEVSGPKPPRARPLPVEGQQAGTTPSPARPVRPVRQISLTPPRPRIPGESGAAVPKRAEGKTATSPTRPVSARDKPAPRPGRAAASAPQPAPNPRPRDAEGEETSPASRPARPVRKPGWAKPKPKAGPRRPKR